MRKLSCRLMLALVLLLLLGVGCTSKVTRTYGPNGEVLSETKTLTNQDAYYEAQAQIRKAMAQNPRRHRIEFRPLDPGKPVVVQNASIVMDVAADDPLMHAGPLAAPRNEVAETVDAFTRPLGGNLVAWLTAGWMVTSTSADRREENLAAQARPTYNTEVGGDYYTGDRSGPVGGNRYDGTGNGDNRDNPTDNSDHSQTETPPGGGGEN
ncbi:MAG: hypothetical protein KQJ78_14855 [Deltaproteobacteria bacterium]|nr:hypothetical protein [Deltaproteobacteria bacterium]